MGKPHNNMSMDNWHHLLFDGLDSPIVTPSKGERSTRGSESKSKTASDQLPMHASAAVD